MDLPGAMKPGSGEADLRRLFKLLDEPPGHAAGWGCKYRPPAGTEEGCRGSAPGVSHQNFHHHFFFFMVVSTSSTTWSIG